MLDRLTAKIKGLRLGGDKVIWILIMIFAMVSIVAISSSSSYRANAKGVEKAAIFIEQFKLVGAGFLTLFICYLIPMRVYRRFSLLIYGTSIVLLLASLLFGKEVNGAQRGLMIAGHSIQVLEFAKIGLVVYLAVALERWQDSLDSLKDYCLKLLLPIGASCLLTLPNSVSTVLLLGLLSLLIMFFMGVKVKHLLFTIGLAVAALIFVVLIYNAFYRDKKHPEGEKPGKVEKLFNRVGTAQNRFLSFSKEKEEQDLATMDKAERQKFLDEKRQSENAKIAISEGGIFGKGPGMSTQRYFLSEAFSDFIYAFIVEEYGLVGGLFVFMLYAFFFFRCMRICQKCKTPYSQSLVMGLALLISIQALLHIYVNVRIIPITGHTLPLISHGGNAFIVLSAAFGMILSVSRQLEKKETALLAEAETGQGEPAVQEEETENEQ